jgi:rhamnosyl/mannosyltransferase
MAKGRLVPDLAIAAYERLALPWMLGRAAAVICASDYVRNQFLAPWKSKSLTVSPGVDTMWFAPNDAPKVPGRVLFVGDFRDPRKGLEVLIRAVQQVPQAHLRVVGYGEAAASERVEYAGVVRGEDLVREYQSAQLLVLPSTTSAESFGMVLVEAMACGLPVVASNIGGMPAVVHAGRDGLLVPPGDVPALAVAIRQLLEHPEQAHALGTAGRIKAERRYHWTTRYQQTGTVLQQAAAASAAREVQHG